MKDANQEVDNSGQRADELDETPQNEHENSQRQALLHLLHDANGATEKFQVNGPLRLAQCVQVRDQLVSLKAARDV